MYRRLERNLSVEGRSRRTFDTYVHHAAVISLHFGRPPLALSSDEVRDYLFMLQQRSSTPSLSYFKHTVYALRFILKSEGLSYDYLQLPEIKKTKQLPVVLSKSEVWRLLFAPRLLKHRILLGLLYGCGLRCQEARNVRLNDLDFDRRTLHVVRGKGVKDRYVPLSTHLIRGLKTYISAEKPQEWLFNGDPNIHKSDLRYSQRTIQWIVKKAVQVAGLSKEVHTHTLRHSFATHLLEDGLDIVSIKDLMGHACVKTTMVYLHVAQSNPQRIFSPLDTLFQQCAGKGK